MEKTVRVLLLFIIMIFFIGCGGGKYDDAIEINKDFIKIAEEYTQELEKAESGKAVAKAMDNYSAKFAKLAPKMKKIKEKYPDIKNDKDVPAEFREMEEKAQQAGIKLAGSFMKIMKYMTDPDVLEAQKKMAQSMQEMNK
ncbi:hypothetical protein QUF70_00370 [Desulfobacterales bacterium HSG17]|nr:hypothetical protein [Desulfobacterales bacterium HSG17]